MDILIRNKAFWAAVLVLLNAILYYFVPTFPKEIWAAFDAVAAIIIGSLAISESRRAVVARRADRKQE